jgi:hypothetical protein
VVVENWRATVKECCFETGEVYFAAQYPLMGTIDEDEYAGYLIDLCKKWGELTNRAAESFYIRTTSSLALGVDAKTGTLKCDSCTDDSYIDYIFIGRRLLYFIWRLGMICATYWGGKQAEESGNMMISIPDMLDWPRPEHLEQVHIAFDMYFGDDPYLGTEGLSN